MPSTKDYLEAAKNTINEKNQQVQIIINRFEKLTKKVNLTTLKKELAFWGTLFLITSISFFPVVNNISDSFGEPLISRKTCLWLFLIFDFCVLLRFIWLIRAYKTCKIFQFDDSFEELDLNKMLEEKKKEIETIGNTRNIVFDSDLNIELEIKNKRKRIKNYESKLDYFSRIRHIVCLFVLAISFTCGFLSITYPIIIHRINVSCDYSSFQLFPIVYYCIHATMSLVGSIASLFALLILESNKIFKWVLVTIISPLLFILLYIITMFGFIPTLIYTSILYLLLAIGIALLIKSFVD